MEEIRFGRIVFIPGQKGGRYPFCNSLFIDDETKAIIDPASDETCLLALQASKGIDVIVNSHYHEDHIAFNYLFPDAELYVHEAIAPCFKSYQSYLDYCGLLESSDREAWDEFFLKRYHYRERTPALAFKDGDVLTFGSTKAVVLHTPGHTIGHCSFLFPDEGVLFMGDHDLTHFGPWYSDRVSDIEQTIRSVERLLTIPAEVYVTSHELGILRGDLTKLAADYLDIIRQRQERIVSFLEVPRTLEEMVDQWLIHRKRTSPGISLPLPKGACSCITCSAWPARERWKRRTGNSASPEAGPAPCGA